MVEQGPAEPSAGAGRINRYLLNVQAAVDHLGDEEPSWAVVNAGDHPQPFGLCAGGKRASGDQSIPPTSAMPTSLNICADARSIS